jgi:hypothetical protein
MTQKPLQHIIQISNRDASQPVGVMVLDDADEDEALTVARVIALDTGHRVTVRDGKLALIETIPAASIH